MKAIPLIVLLIALAAAYHFVMNKPVPPKSAAPHHYAPAGVYFLKEYVSVAVPGGVVGWTPGQELHVVPGAPHPDDSVMLTDGTVQSLVAIWKLTGDIEAALAMRQDDSQAQDSLRAMIADASARAAEVQLQRDIASAPESGGASAPPMNSATAPTYASMNGSASRDGQPVTFGVPTTFVVTRPNSSSGSTTAGGAFVPPPAVSTTAPHTSVIHYPGNRMPAGGGARPGASPSSGLGVQ